MEGYLFEDRADAEAFAHIAVKNDRLAFGVDFPSMGFGSFAGSAGRFADLPDHLVERMEIVVEEHDAQRHIDRRNVIVIDKRLGQGVHAEHGVRRPQDLCKINDRSLHRML